MNSGRPTSPQPASLYFIIFHREYKIYFPASIPQSFHSDHPIANFYRPALPSRHPGGPVQVEAVEAPLLAELDDVRREEARLGLAGGDLAEDLAGQIALVPDLRREPLGLEP